jgi:hypothetical protein
MKKTPVETRIYNSWRHVQQVIYNPRNLTNQRWQRNGWPLEEDLGGFKEFLAWTLKKLGPPPDSLSRLVRKDQTRGYLRRNLEWGTHLQQGERLRRTIRVRYQGRSQCITNWSRETGIPYHILYFRHQQGQLNLAEIIRQYHGKTTV